MDEASQEWVSRFLEHLRHERRFSAHTLDGYQRDLRAFSDFLSKNKLNGWDAIDSHDIRAFAAANHRRGMAPRSIQRRLSAVRSFFHYLIREGVVASNPATEVSAPKAAARLPETLDTDQMARLLALNPTDALAVRDLAIMELLYSSGLRLAELISVELQDIDLKDRTIRVTGKGSKTRILPIGGHATNAIRAWLKRRSEFAGPDENAVFVSQRGTHLSRRSVQNRIKLWAGRQGVSSRVYPHLFRHSFATHVLESSGDLRGVQELLGHADISTTQVYTHLDFQHLARIYDKAHPRARRRS